MRGRKTKYNAEIAEEICKAIATSSVGVSILCKSNAEWPCEDTIHKWLKEFPEFTEQYARARVLQADFLADEIIAIADDSTNDTVVRTGIDGESYTVEDKEWTGRSKLRIDARKWKASKLAPKVYGDKLELGGDLTLKNQNIIRLADGTEISI